MSPSLIENFGESVIRFLEQIYIVTLEVLIKTIKILEGFVKPIKEFDRDHLYPFFKNRNIELNDYTVFKLQLFSSIFLIITTLFIINRLSIRNYIAMGAFVTLMNVYILYSTVKNNFIDFNAYRDFFLSYHILAIILAIIKVRKPVIGYGFPFLHFAVVAVIGAIIIYAYFNNKYSRDYTFGRVLSDRGVDLEVKLNYDIRSNTKPQTTYLRKTINAREGDIVKIRVMKGFLSIKGSMPVDIIGVEWS